MEFDGSRQNINFSKSLQPRYSPQDDKKIISMQIANEKGLTLHLYSRIKLG